MDIKFQPQAIELTITLTPAEAAQILIDLPPILFSTKTPLGRLAKALHHVSRMNSDSVVNEALAEFELSNNPEWGVNISLPTAEQLGRKPPGQGPDSRP